MIIVNSDHSRYEIVQLIKKQKFKGCLIKQPRFHKDITFALVENQTPFHRISYGAGVYKILPNAGSICEHCEGKGIIE